MGSQNTSLLDDDTATASLTALAGQLRDGPLHELLELQRRANALANGLADSPAHRVEDLEALVLMSLTAMEQFHAFTREFVAVLRELSDARRQPH
jgi:hypothetical protein